MIQYNDTIFYFNMGFQALNQEYFRTGYFRTTATQEKKGLQGKISGFFS